MKNLSILSLVFVLSVASISVGQEQTSPSDVTQAANNVVQGEQQPVENPGIVVEPAAAAPAADGTLPMEGAVAPMQMGTTGCCGQTVAPVQNCCGQSMPVVNNCCRPRFAVRRPFFGRFRSRGCCN